MSDEIRDMEGNVSLTEGAMSLEDNFKQMELLIKRLEQENISLEEAFSAYSRGMEVLKNCNEQLDMVEKKVLKLSATGQLEEFWDGR